MSSQQLALDLWPDAADDTAAIAAGLYRHSLRLADHQRGLIRLEYDFGSSGWRKGDLIPAWICCVCGIPEPSEFVLGINHGCHSHYAAETLHRLQPKQRFRLA